MMWAVAFILNISQNMLHERSMIVGEEFFHKAQWEIVVLSRRNSKLQDFATLESEIGLSQGCAALGMKYFWSISSMTNVYPSWKYEILYNHYLEAAKSKN